MSEQKNTKINHIEKELFSDSERLEFWIAANWKRASLAALAVVIVAVAIFAAVRHVRNQKNAAEEKLADTKVEELAAVLDNFKNCSGAPVARFRLARFLVEKKQWNEAAAQLKSIVGDSQCDPLLHEMARFALAEALELSGNFTGAAEEYLAIESDNAVSAAGRMEALYQAARLRLRSKDLKGAKALLDRAGTQPAMGEDQMVAMWRSQCMILRTALANGEFAAAAAAQK